MKRIGLILLLLLISCAALAQSPKGNDVTGDKKDTTTNAEETGPNRPGQQSVGQTREGTRSARLQLLAPDGGAAEWVWDGEDGNAPQLNQFFNRAGQADGNSLILSMGGFDGLSKARVSLDLHDTPIREAVKQLFDQVKAEKQTLEYTVDKDVPEDKKVTLHLDNVRFQTALRALTDAAGVGYQVTTKWEQGKDRKNPQISTRVTIGKTRSNLENGLRF